MFSGFEKQSFFAGPAQYKMNFNSSFRAGPMQSFEETKRVNCTTCSGNANHNSQMASGET
jgi:hypothetical protein